MENILACIKFVKISFNFIYIVIDEYDKPQALMPRKNIFK